MRDLGFEQTKPTRVYEDNASKSLPAPTFEKHRVYLRGSSIPFSAFVASLDDIPAKLIDMSVFHTTRAHGA